MWWIDIKEARPEDYMLCVVFSQGKCRIRKFYPCGWEEIKEDSFNEKGITHWMPVPETPETRSHFRAGVEVGVFGDVVAFIQCLFGSYYLEPHHLTDEQKENFNKKMPYILQGLSLKERFVLQFRYGFFDGKTHTLDECSSFIKTTKEVVRQYEAKGFRKLRHPTRLRMIISFIRIADANRINEIYGNDIDFDRAITAEEYLQMARKILSGPKDDVLDRLLALDKLFNKQTRVSHV